MSEIYGHESTLHLNKLEAPPERWTKEFLSILTCESSRSFFCENVKGSLTITNEAVKNFVLDKLYEIISKKISQLDADYQEILKSKGDYLKYKQFASLDSTVIQLSELLAEQPERLATTSKYQLEQIFLAHENIKKNVKHFKDAFSHDIAAIKQYYLIVVADIIYATGFIVTTMIDYERRNGTVAYDIIYKNIDILERGLPKNMMATIETFNADIKRGAIFKTISTMKNSKPKAAVSKESTEVSLELAVIAGVGIGLISLIVLIPLIRHSVYFFLHSKIRLAEYFEQQAMFLELNIARLKSSGAATDKVIKKQEESVKKLHAFAAKLSGNTYATEKEVTTDIAADDRQAVDEADKQAKDEENDSPDGFSDSDILL